MTSNTEHTNTDLLDKLDTVECWLAEISVAIANAVAACDELEQVIPLPQKFHTTMLSAHIASMYCSCAKAEATCTELQAAISEPIF